MRLIVRRVKPTPGSQLALFVNYSYHAFITDRAGALLELEADHRRHAEIENAIRASSTASAASCSPAGRRASGSAVTTRTLRRRYFALAGRLTHSARRWTLHLPKRWPWAGQLAAALARLRALPLPA